MLEVEMKFPVESFLTLEKQLGEWGATVSPVREEADHYFNAPDRDFAQTDEVFRLRRVGDTNLITYKGPKRDLQTKSRTELEVPLEKGPDAAEGFIQLLNYLRYRFVDVVRKQRRVYRLERGGYTLEFCLDQVEEVGRYVELEILAPDDQQEAAKAVLLGTATQLGLTAQERRSYLQLLLTKRSQASS